MTKLIAEFCQNHNGDFELLARMIEAAAQNGATHAKMQTIYADTVAFRPQFELGLVQNGVRKAITRPYNAEYKRLKGLEISEKEMIRFVSLCHENGVTPMTTCFVRAHVDILSEIGFNAIKVASYDCASFQLLRELSQHFSEIVVSTGATYDDEVIKASEILSGTKFSLLHCVTLYPTPLEQMHMARMEWLRELTDYVGYSDHSLVSETGLIASKAALALGADIIERHFTLLTAEETKDGPVSISPDQLQELSSFSKLSISERAEFMDREHPQWKIVMGKKNRKLSDAELLNRDYYRGRFASPRKESEQGMRMINNWEETSL